MPLFDDEDIRQFDIDAVFEDCVKNHRTELELFTRLRLLGMTNSEIERRVAAEWVVA